MKRRAIQIDWPFGVRGPTPIFFRPGQGGAFFSGAVWTVLAMLALQWTIHG